MTPLNGTVYIVEDNDSFRKSMMRLVSGFGCEAIAFETANAFLSVTEYDYPGCILLDVRLPDLDGLKLQEALIEKGCRLPIIFMSGHGDIPMSVKAMKKGAIDFLPKPFKPEELRGAIDSAMTRSNQVNETEQEKERINALIDTLTPREKEVMRWIITGLLNKQIAWELGTSEKTIKVHRSRVLQKTGASSVAELVRLAEKVDIEPAEIP